MSRGSARWWATKLRQARRHVVARVSPGERAALAGWLTPEQLRLFDSMHVADRRHGLDVVAWLRTDGTIEPDVLVAGLLHDAGKGQTGFVPRVAHAMSQAYGSGVARAVTALPGMGAPMRRLADHAEVSARLAEAAGCSARTVDLIRHQDDDVASDRAAQRLHLADEVS